MLFFILAFLYTQHLNFSFVAGITFIGIGEKLNSTTQLVSPGGNFTLGFFNITETNLTYLGIWYTADDQHRRVWITAGETTLLNISNQDSRDLVAKLEDSGNFVLIDEARKLTLWQSFDYPTDTLLPGMKLGSNSATGRNWYLVSWLSDDVPADGAFRLSWEPDQGESGELVLDRRNQRYWASGCLVDDTFAQMPQLNSPSSQYHYKLVFVSNNSEKYFYFSAADPGPAMWRLTPEGNIHDALSQAVFTPFIFCYGYQSGDGCVVLKLHQCRSNREKFEEKRASFPTGVANGIEDYNSSLSLSDSMEKCWNDCSCVGFNKLNSNGTSCITYQGKFDYIEGVNIVPMYVLPRQKSSNAPVWLWIVIAVGTPLLLLRLGTFFYMRIRKRGLEDENRRREKYIHKLIASDSFKNANDIDDVEMENHDLKVLSFASIVEATSNFIKENKLGEGGFGPVHKGKLQDGREIAVKRLSRSSGQGLVEFKNELILIAKLQHKNLVRVLGCCIHGEEKMLIYEYLPNRAWIPLYLVCNLHHRGHVFDPISTHALHLSNRSS
ncbi:Non-specific serine/threonine protein kinase [Bertholletia excelsa]